MPPATEEEIGQFLKQCEEKGTKSDELFDRLQALMRTSENLRSEIALLQTVHERLKADELDTVERISAAFPV